MVNEEFNSMNELYERVLPALHSKRKEFMIKKINFIDEKDIWNCLRNLKWQKEFHLTLYDIVSDILALDELTILEYIKNKD